MDFKTNKIKEKLRKIKDKISEFDFNKLMDEFFEFKSVFLMTAIFILSAFLTFFLKDSQFVLVLSLITLFLAIWIWRHLLLPNDEHMKAIFVDLKNKGAIDKTREIRCDKRGQIFRSGLFFYNTIFYNEKSFSLDDNTIRFALLHEEGHKANKQYVTPPLFFILTLVMVPVIFLFLVNSDFHSDISPAEFHQFLFWNATIICISVLFIVSMIKTLSEPLIRDEYRSDEYAAKMLMEKFDITTPSIIVDNTFKDIRKQFGITEEKQDSIKNRLLFAFLKYHPKDEDRVKNIREKFDVK